jgi:hypothetical protein
VGQQDDREEQEKLDQQLYRVLSIVDAPGLGLLQESGRVGAIAV